MPSFFCLNVKHAQNNILEKAQISLDSDGIIMNLMTKSLIEENLVYKDTCMNIFIVMVIMVSLRILQ